jgi:hypothetical protein
MSIALDRVPLERISAEAREVRFGRTVLLLLAGLLYGVGWLAAKVFVLLWRAVAWVGVAIKLGWTEARKPSVGGP